VVYNNSSRFNGCKMINTGKSELRNKDTLTVKGVAVFSLLCRQLRAFFAFYAFQKVLEEITI